MNAFTTRVETRAPVQVVIFWLGYLTILLVVGFARGFLPHAAGALLWGVVCSALLLAVTGVFLRRDRRSWADIGLGASRGSPVRLLGGFVLGFSLYAVIVLATSLVIAPVSMVPQPTPAAALLLLVAATYVGLGAMEELGFRAYPLWTLHDAYGP